jgi:MoxR-like ATPase
MVKYSELDIHNVDKIVGSNYIARAKEVLRLLKTSNVPIMFTGVSGAGKTVTAKNIAAVYAKKFNVPAYFIQLSPDQTKTNIILGLRLINGSLQVYNGVVAEAMERGGIIIVDEATHATQSLLLMFNSLMDIDSVTSVGDKIIKAKDTFRVIFCCNDSKYSGNVKLPQSFCNRLITYNFEYPEFEEEVQIAENMLEKNNIDYNEQVLKYFVKLMTQLRDTEIPLSVRNVYSAMLLFSVKGLDSEEEVEVEVTGDMETKFKKIISMITGTDVKNINKNDILNEEEFIKYIYKVGFSNINEIIKQCFMYYLDIDGSVFVKNNYKNRLEGFLL